MCSISFKKATILTFIFFLPFAFAHKGHEHPVAERPVTEEVKKDDALLSIKVEYLKDIEPIFLHACADCHSDRTQFPWYSGLPFIKGLIEGDIKEARTHIDISRGFPFQGHGTPKEDLKAIWETIDGGDMPPFSYRLMHPSAKLSQEEKEKVKTWVEESLEKL